MTILNEANETSCSGQSTHLDTKEKASAHTAGHGTSLIITCSAAAWKCALVTFSSTEARVATSPALVLGSPPAVSKMFPPCTTSSSTWVLHLLCKKRVEVELKKTYSKRETHGKGKNILWTQWGHIAAACEYTERVFIIILPLYPPVLQCYSEGHSVVLPAGRDPLYWVSKG